MACDRDDAAHYQEDSLHVSDRSRVEEALRGARYGQKWIRVPCPFCADDGHTDRKHSLGVSSATGFYTCFRCGSKGKLLEPPDPNAAAQRELELTLPEKDAEAFEPPEEYIPLSSRTGRRSMSLEPARAYLLKRGVTEEAWARYKIGAAIEGYWAGRIIVPMLAHDDDDMWLGWIARLWAGPFPASEGRDALKYLYPKGMPRGRTFWNHRELLRETKRPVLVVEGVFDALPHAANAVACLGKPSHHQVAWLYEAKRPIVACLDGDAWRESWALAARLRFDGLDAGFVRLIGKTDPNQIPPDVLLAEARKALKSAL